MKRQEMKDRKTDVERGRETRAALRKKSVTHYSIRSGHTGCRAEEPIDGGRQLDSRTSRHAIALQPHFRQSKKGRAPDLLTAQDIGVHWVDFDDIDGPG